MRIAICGASGTGKTTLALGLADDLNLEVNPVGSRSVCAKMGFDSPYDVDKAGKRREFQLKLLQEKYKWETKKREFITDRTPLDNLIYTMFHDVYGLDEEYLKKIRMGMERYTHLIYCPVHTFCSLGKDPARVQEMTYHKLYDYTMQGVLANFPRPAMLTLTKSTMEARRIACLDFLETRKK
jgi:molybdopterin-guanine dinucleotide biosynthesis protein